MSYFERPELSQSQLKDFMVSPAYYQLRLKKPRQETYEMMIGTATHSALLEPESFAENYVCIPKIDRRTKAGKEQFDLYTKESFGKIAIQEDDYLSILAMRDSVLEHPRAKDILSFEKEVEKEIFFSLEDVPCRAKLDAIVPKINTIIDFKTSRSSSSKSFQKDMINNGYDIQAFWYFEAYKSLTGSYPDFYAFIVASKEEPYPVSVFSVDKEFIDRGRYKSLKALAEFKECKGKNVWPKNESDEIIAIQTPQWALKDLMEDGDAYFSTIGV